MKVSAWELRCMVTVKFVNSIFYADDLVLKAPSTFPLQRLIDTCSAYADMT